LGFEAQYLLANFSMSLSTFWASPGSRNPSRKYLHEFHSINQSFNYSINQQIINNQSNSKTNKQTKSLPISQSTKNLPVPVYQ
jgi:hypothetical protein